MNPRANSIFLCLVLAGALAGQTPTASGSLSDLGQISKELNESVKRFHTHLNETIARHDRGYRRQDGRMVQSADVDLIGGPADVLSAAVQRFATFRMLAARRQGYEPPPVADLDHIQSLILEARNRVDAANAILRRMLIVPAVELDPRKVADTRATRDQLRNARWEVQEAAKQALLALPLDQMQAGTQPDKTSPRDTAQNAWDLLGRGLPAQKEKAGPPPGVSIPAIPIRLQQRKRITLINEASWRMAITDSGIEDAEGRHLFYQEEWVRRGASVIRLRWRVAVETATGRHILLKRYPPLEMHGSLAELYSHLDRDYLWYLEPSDDSAPPPAGALASAIAEVAHSREMLRSAALRFKTEIREALAEQDLRRASANEALTDSGLPGGLRETLFAIRAHMARVPAVLQSENAVRRAVTQAESAVRDLEPLAAWANREANREADRAPEDWLQLLNRADREIDAVRSAETEAWASLPPDSSLAEDQFPALEKNIIVRIRRSPARNPRDTAVRCLEEIWRMDGGMLGVREVRRTASLILVDPQTGDQTRVGMGAIDYKAAPGDLLEEIYDEYAADEVALGT